MDILGIGTPSQEERVLTLPTGVIVAALFAASLGLMALAISNIWAEVDPGFKAWITLNSGVGPYSGKMVFLFATWFLSWPILHVALRKRELNLKTWFGAFLFGMLMVTVLMWPPVFKAIADGLKGG